MKSVIASLVAVAGLSAAAVAEVNTRLDMMVSLDGVNWASSVDAAPGQTVQVLVRANYIGSGNALGLASAFFQPTVSNWQAADALSAFAGGGWGSNTTNPTNMVAAGAAGAGAYGRVSPFGRTNIASTSALRGHIHSGGSAGAPAGTWLRIAQNQVTGWMGFTGNTTGGSGVGIAQLNDVGRVPTDPAFNGQLSGVELFRFGITLDAADDDRPDLIVDAPALGFGNRNATTGEREFYWFGSMTEATGQVRGTAIVTTGTINVVPAPASLALLGLGGLCVARRRR